jgi:site-specific recombinase XerD
MEQVICNPVYREPWNKGKLVGQKAPLKLKDIWAIRVRLQLSGHTRDLALFNLAIDSKLRACDLVKPRVRDVSHGERIAARTIVMQQKTQRPVQFEITEQTREALAVWIRRANLRLEDFLFPSRVRRSPHLSTRQYARIVDRWIHDIGLDPGAYGTHTMRRTKASLIYRRTKNLRAVIMTGQPSFGVLLERFFTQRLMQQRRASTHTIASYRDSFSLLLKFTHKRLHRAPSALALDDIDAPLVMAFLDELERVRGITARTRNLRLTAVHSFFRFAAFEAPSHSAQIQRVLAIPAKRFTRTLVPFLSRQEVDALLAAPDQRSWSGRRDHALLLLAVQTGLRLSELTSLRREDLHVDAGAHIRVIGKGRKERCTPLSKNTRAVLTAWAREPPRAENQPLFPNARGGRLSAHGVHYLLNKHVAMAAVKCPSLTNKRVSPHVLRHYLPFLTMSCTWSTAASSLEIRVPDQT